MGVRQGHPGHSLVPREPDGIPLSGDWAHRHLAQAHVSFPAPREAWAAFALTHISPPWLLGKNAPTSLLFTCLSHFAPRARSQAGVERRVPTRLRPLNAWRISCDPPCTEVQPDIRILKHKHISHRLRMYYHCVSDDHGIR